MAKTTYVFRNGKLVKKDQAEPRNATNIISDIMPSTRHMADGKLYTSKAKFRQATRDAGCVEVGNEVSTLLKPRAPVQLDPGRRRDEIRRAISELRNR